MVSTTQCIQKLLMPRSNADVYCGCPGGSTWCLPDFQQVTSITWVQLTGVLNN